MTSDYQNSQLDVLLGLSESPNGVRGGLAHDEGVGLLEEAMSQLSLPVHVHLYMVVSQIIVVGLALLHEGSHALSHSLGVEKGVEDAPLQSDALSLREVFIFLDSLLSCQKSREGLVGDFLGNLNYFLVEIIEGIDLTDDAQLIGTFGRNELGCEDVSVGIHSASNSSQSA